MRKIVCLLLVTTALLSKAASQIPDHVPLMTSTWDVLAMKTYKYYPDKTYRVFFPPDLKALDNKEVELPGYMIPIKSGMTHQVFMLSVLPVLQCQFCGQANIPSMVEVFAQKAAVYVEAPIKVTGILHLESAPDQPEFTLTKAKIELLK